MAGSESGYFGRFPTVMYDGVEAIDITRRVRLGDSLLRQPTIFYPYTLKEGTRADSLVFDYYQDPDVEWLPYIANGIIDPYFGWYLTESEFGRYIENKYGSIEDTQLRIKHWVTNWSDQDTNISTTYFGSLPEELQKYWIPVYGLGSKVIAYKRREEDWFTSTNMIVKVEITGVEGPGFEIGELVDFTTGTENIGFAEVVQVTTDALFLKNLIDTFENLESVLVGHGGTRATPVTVTIMSQDIDLTEAQYWSPVSVYDWEVEKNEANKELTLIDLNYVPQVLRELTKKLA